MTCIATAPVSPSRAYQYDTLGRPTSRTLARQGATRNDVFTYNDRSELVSDVVDDTDLNGWDYDNIGNRRMEQRMDGYEIYTANQLNQYTAIEDESHEVFTPTYDDDGNQTRIKTSTGIWNVTYNAKNRPVLFSKEGENLTVACTYDYMGRRATKVVTENGVVTTSHRFLYRGYLQIACCDRTRSAHPSLWLITWDPSQPVATRPLAIQKDSTWYTYGWDLTKNIWEAYTTTGYIGTAYTYTAYGSVTATGNVTQPIQWSSEYNDTELALVYYNYRYYNPLDGRWIGRDAIIASLNDCLYCSNTPVVDYDYIGLVQIKEKKCHNVSNCLGGAMTNQGNQYRYPKVSRYRKDNMIKAMKKAGWLCREVKTVKDCQCASNEAKILITLYQDSSNYQKKYNPWTDARFPWGKNGIDLHAIRADAGQGDNYKQISHASTQPQDFNTNIKWKIFIGNPLLCCCEMNSCPNK